MSGASIERFCVYELHDHQDIEIAIQDNRLILVGANGIGKSTVLNMLYFFITQQWARLNEYQFDKVSITLNGVMLVVSKNQIIEVLYNQKRLRDRMPIRIATAVEKLKSTSLFSLLLSAERLTEVDKLVLAEALGVDSRQVERIRLELREDGDLAWLNADNNGLSDISAFLRQNITERVIYLPTYRRIEKDLKYIVPDIEEKFRAYRNNILTRRETDAYLELIEFGMEDVATLLDEKLKSISHIEKNEFNDLVGSYLSQVIHGKAATFDFDRVRNLSSYRINSILDRVKEENLKLDDREHIRKAIEKISVSARDLSEEDRYIALLFSNLMNMADTLESTEVSLNKFTEYCSVNYLVGKEIVYDKKEGKVYIIRHSDGMPIEMRYLSSGEKQIVSLFCHLCLTENRNFIVIIDEPELSLSVDWQKCLLPDIIDTGKCTFLGAVTHSPFIFENELDSYASDLTRHTRLLHAH